MTPSEVLVKTKEVLIDPKSWTQGTAAQLQ
jgi:hypothetical protein